MTSRPTLDERLQDLERDFSVDELVELISTLLSRTDAWRELLVHYTSRVAEESDVLDAAAFLAAQHHALAGDEAWLRSWLSLLTVRNDVVRQIGGEPRHVLDEAGQGVLAQALVQGEAVRAIWREPMREPRDAAVALGARATNREKVRQYRKRSWLLGLPAGRGYVYPAFQFDPERRDVFAEVRAVNERLEAADDPWGVASWWIARHARLGAPPADLVGTRRADDLVAAADAAIEPIG